MNRAERTAGQIAHLQQHAALFAATVVDDRSIEQYMWDHADIWDLYQRVCGDLQIEPNPDLCHPNPED